MHEWVNVAGAIVGFIMGMRADGRLDTWHPSSLLSVHLCFSCRAFLQSSKQICEAYLPRQDVLRLHDRMCVSGSLSMKLMLNICVSAVLFLETELLSVRSGLRRLVVQTCVRLCVLRPKHSSVVWPVPSNRLCHIQQAWSEQTCCEQVSRSEEAE